MTALPVPEFIPTDVLARLSAAILRFEQATGQTLYPAQPERLPLNSLVYEINLLATQLDLAMRRQLVEFADYPVLDRLARFYGLARLPPAPARTTIKITRAAADSLLILPTKTKLGGAASFTTNEELVFQIRVFEANCLAPCTTPGKAYNGLAPGKINVFQDVLPGLCIENVTETRDGADLESDEALQKRAFLAPEAFTVAGSREAYEARAREVSPAIVAVGVASPRPGDIEITVLTDKGLPGPELVTAVQDRLSDRSIRPMGDSVTVRAPRPHPYRIAASLILRRDAELESSLAAAKAAAEAYRFRQARQLGGDIVPNEIRAALFVPGLYDVILTEPPGAMLTPSDWPLCQAISLNIAGRADE